jgi:RpiR family carbohydrate utilization transcriptional regulator
MEQKITPLLARINGALPSLSKAETKVARYLLDHSEELVHQTITEVAKEAGVAEATVLRFVRTFGFKGFQDLKIHLARELVPAIATIHEDLEENDPPAAILRKVFAGHIQALNDTLGIVDKEEFKRAVDALARAEKILIIGVGTSGPIAVDAFNKFFRLGLTCYCQTDSHLQVMMGALLSSSDVALAISHSGSTKDPIETLNACKEAGATTICITNNSLSPITRVADIKLFTASRETKFRHEALASRIAQTAIINGLYVALSFRDLERSIENTKKIENAIVIKQY